MPDRIDTRAVLEELRSDVEWMNDPIIPKPHWYAKSIIHLWDALAQEIAALNAAADALERLEQEFAIDHAQMQARIEALEKRQQPLVRLLGLARANEDLTDSEVWNDECDAALAAEEET